MNETTKFKVPDNTEFIEQSLENGMLITKFIPKEYVNDLECWRIKNHPRDVFAIFKNQKYAYCLVNSYNEILLLVDGEWESDKRWSKITREEMQSELAKHGKVFDFDNKVLKYLKYRADRQVDYFFMDSFFNPDITTECFYNSDDIRFNNGNYFRTEQDCQAFCDKVKKLLNN